LQPVDIKSRWRHNWISAQVVNSHLLCDPTIRQPGFDLPWQQWSLLNRFCTEQGHCGACRRKWRLTDTEICVLVVRPRQCITLSNPVPWQNWIEAYLGYTLRMKMLFCGWPGHAYKKKKNFINAERRQAAADPRRLRLWVRLTDTDLCPCGETQTMSHIVKSCPLTKLNGGISRLHCANEDSVLWLTMTCIWE